MATVIVNSKESFDSIVLGSSLPVVADFFAPWCGHCKRLSPVIDRMAEEYEGKVQFVKVDTDAFPESGSLYGISVVPTLFLFQNGEHGPHIVAPASQEDIETWMNSQLK